MGQSVKFSLITPTPEYALDAAKTVPSDEAVSGDRPD